MTRIIVFQIHWFLGITAGVVLAWMGVTGATMTFREEILEAVSPRMFAPGIPASPDLSPDELVKRVEIDNPGYYVSRLDLESDRHRAHGVSLLQVQGNGWRLGLADRATGAWLGEAPGTGFFNALADLHRWLTLPGGSNVVGRQLTGASALALVFFALSGLYLRWPRRVTDWRSWLALDLRKTGRNLWRALHATIGTWVLLFYLMSGLTGLWWCYDWYQRGVTYALVGHELGSDAAAASSPNPASVRLSVDRAWAEFRRETGSSYASTRIALPPPGQLPETLTFEARPFKARHLRQTDLYSFDAQTGRPEGRDFYEQRALGRVLADSIFELHRGSFFGLPGRIMILLTSATMPLFTITGYLLYLSRRRRKHEARRYDADTVHGEGAADLVIAFGTQTGGAERRAREAALAFKSSGLPVRVFPLSQLTPDLLESARTALFVVSTYGEGQPPDMARGFVRRMMHAPAHMDHLEYGVLAMGDREYADFCAFGSSLDSWLSRSGARPLFKMIAMDDDSPEAGRAWRDELELLGATNVAEQSVPWSEWRLVAREALNPLSAHAKAYQLKFQPVDARDLTWAAGDIVEIEPQNDPAEVERILAQLESVEPRGADKQALRLLLSQRMLPVDGMLLSMEDLTSLRPLPAREYSAASVPTDATLDLVVRQVRDRAGRLGVGSGWLTQHMNIGATLSLRVRPNPGFRIGSDDASLILIGNGTGIAGLRAHLRAMAHRRQGGHWLIFGERQRSHELFFDDEIQAWLADGTLARVDRAFSRDRNCGRYVQDLVVGARDEIADWIDRGAIILVCGSLEGMAPAVNKALENSVGEERLEQLAEEGRYKRDVY
jgi:sulfite reductase (NADPH) flavoprotein alpha-component